MASEHGVTLLETDMQEIFRIVEEIRLNDSTETKQE
jgi:hypothetical protein